VNDGRKVYPNLGYNPSWIKPLANTFRYHEADVCGLEFGASVVFVSDIFPGGLPANCSCGQHIQGFVSITMVFERSNVKEKDRCKSKVESDCSFGVSWPF